MAGRTLHVRCATWEQVETFTTRKLRKGNLLSMRVPFAAKVGTPVTLGLELPSEVVIAIDGVIHRTSPVDGDAASDTPTTSTTPRSWIEIELTGFTDDVRARLARLAQSDGRAEELLPAAPPRRPTLTQLGEDLPADERELFHHLSSELRRLRQAAVHEVLDVSRDAGPAEVRDGWKEMIRRNHPDLVARRNAPAISHLAEELTILVNRAYDRMRARLVADGRGAVAGPTLASPPGWLVAFDDIPSGEGMPGSGPHRFERAKTPPPEPAAPASASGQGDAYEQRARAMLAGGDPDTAREVLAAALVVYPRSKPLRSLYHVATALAALQDGEIMLATSQLETALAHHEHCVEATKVLEHIRKHGSQRADDVRRLFR